MKRTYVFQERVHFPDIDFGGGMYHGRYMDYLDKARSAMYREHRIDIAKLFKLYFALVVVDARLKYLRPVVLDDMLFIYTRVIGYTEKSITLDQRVANFELPKELLDANELESHSIVNKATITLVGANYSDRKSVALPGDFADLLMSSWRPVL